MPIRSHADAPRRWNFRLTRQGAVLWLLAFSPALIAAAPPLHTSGGRIADSRGARVPLHAVNWYGAEGSDFVVTGLEANSLENIAKAIRSRGFNAVRLPWSNQLYESNPVVPGYALKANTDLEGFTALAIFDRVVSVLTGAGLMVILDNHTSTAMWCCNNDVNNLWYNDAYPESRWISDWLGMARRYAANPLVIGADLRNEPRVNATWGGNPATDWHAAAERAGNAILAVNPNLLIFVEGVSYAGDLSGAASLPVKLDVPNRVVYEAHDYGFWYSRLADYTDWYNRIHAKWGYLAEDNSAPLWIGEFGTCNNAPTCVSSTKNTDLGYWFGFLDRFVLEHDADWAYWAFNGTTETGHGGGFGTVEGYGIMNASWTADALPALTSTLQGWMRLPRRPSHGREDGPPGEH